MDANYTIVEIDTAPSLDPYHRDTGGETLTQLWIDPRSKKVGISQEYDDNATPIDEWNGLIISRYLSTRPDEGLAEAELTNSELVQRIIDGWDSDWNGNNIVGSLTDDAESALEELSNNLENCDPNPVEMWTCDDWFGNCSDSELGITADLTDEQISELAKKLDNDDNVILGDDLEEWLTERRNSLRD